MRRIGILGAGAWGTALAVVAHEAGCAVVLWARRDDHARAIAETGRNDAYLEDVGLGPGIAATAEEAEAAAVDAVLLAVPAQAVRATCERFSPHLAPSLPVAVCAKGIERDSAKTMSEVLGEALPANPVAILSGPTFAGEVARGQPAAVTLACRDHALAEALAGALATPAFRPYHSDDVAGAEIGGAVKNVLAIACGITEGRGLGENARAALFTRGLAEMTRLARARGGRAETMMGLAGLGDLALTCASRSSRNYRHGVALGAGSPPEGNAVVEGVPTSAAVARLAGRHGVEMPIAEAVAAILHRGADIDAVIAGLLARPRRAEA
ncbi:MAG: NAD(P)-dependent glycerol-3-phosphate dehydrogenase [Defluviicoccus sp.]|nr:NAD(P)-dependent glycerol-3-phosphate dehydrogenase [Defluviicoccus sp.]MDE0385071.1 NAD(P)-dependent glycerol-3-phosphate dehydrogenase [Defluviicoccus sp.]